MDKKLNAFLAVSIFVTVIFMTIFAVWVEIDLINRARTDKKDVFENLSNVIVGINSDKITRGNFFSFNKLIKSLEEKRIVLYAFVIDKNDKRITYSSNASLINKSLESPEVKKILSNLSGKSDKNDIISRLTSSILFTNLSNPIYSNIIILPDNHVAIIYFYLGNIYQVNTIYLLNTLLAIIFIVCGFFSAFVVARKLSEV